MPVRAPDRGKAGPDEAQGLGVGRRRRHSVDYLRDPAAIYERSFAIVRAEAPTAHLPADAAAVARRIVHACGMPDAAGALRAHPEAVARGRAALRAGAPVLTDCRMVRAGVMDARLPGGNAVACHLDDPGVAEAARAAGTTRSAAAVDRWPLDGAVAAIGNAPTALFRLLERVAAEGLEPACVLGFPVGFVGAVESKAALAQSDLPFVTLPDRRGGSAMAAAAVNALAGEEP